MAKVSAESPQFHNPFLERMNQTIHDVSHAVGRHRLAISSTLGIAVITLGSMWFVTNAKGTLPPNVGENNKAADSYKPPEGGSGWIIEDEFDKRIPTENPTAVVDTKPTVQLTTSPADPNKEPPVKNELPWKEAVNLTKDGPVSLDSTGGKPQILAKDLAIKGPFRLKVDTKTEGGQGLRLTMTGENKQRMTVIMDKTQQRVNVLDLTEGKNAALSFNISDFSGLFYFEVLNNGEISVYDEQGHNQKLKARQELNFNGTTVTAEILNSNVTLKASLETQSEESIVIPEPTPIPTATKPAATPTKVVIPTRIPTTAPTAPTQPAAEEPIVETKPTTVPSPEIRSWPEKIGNIEDGVVMYNHGKKMGVISTNWGEISYLAKKLAQMGDVKVKGYEIHWYDWEQTYLIPTVPNADYEQNITWIPRYPGSPRGKFFRTLRPDDILEIHRTLPFINPASQPGKFGSFDNYRDYSISQLDHDLDVQTRNHLCLKNDWRSNASCNDPELLDFTKRSGSYQNGDLSNLKVQFPQAKTP